MKDFHTIIPRQITGYKSDYEYSATAGSPSEAIKLYNDSVARLMDVNEWHSLCGTGSAVFELTDESGEVLDELILKGRFIRIDVPGPGPIAGKGYDWVYIENTENCKINETAECYAITVRPSKSPMTHAQLPAHFFKSRASSTFMVCIHNNTITASVHGRNEIPNSSTDNPIDNLRNEVVAKTAIGLLAGVQWKKLVRGIIRGANE